MRNDTARCRRYLFQWINWVKFATKQTSLRVMFMGCIQYSTKLLFWNNVQYCCWRSIKLTNFQANSLVTQMIIYYCCPLHWEPANKSQDGCCSLIMILYCLAIVFRAYSIDYSILRCHWLALPRMPITNRTESKITLINNYYNHSIVMVMARNSMVKEEKKKEKFVQDVFTIGWYYTNHQNDHNIYTNVMQID